MKKNKSKDTDKKTSKGDSDLDDMREAFRQHKEGRGGGGSGGGNAWDKFEDGKNKRRILPRPGERKFYTEGWTHFRVGPNERAARCIDEAHMDEKRGLPTPETKCPLCKKFLREQARINSEYVKGDEDGRAEWKRAKDKYVPRHQYYCNALVPSDDEVELKIMPFGTQVWSQLLNYYIGDDTEIGDFTDPKAGRWMNIKKEHRGGRDKRNVEYKVYPASDSTDISESWEEIKDKLHDLDAAVGKLLSVDEITAIMKGVDLNKGSGDDEDEDEGEDEDEEEEDEKDDDEDRPVKKGQLAAKMKKRRD
jgi:hypothetical protein